VSDFERSYLARLNRIGLWFFALHLPIFMLVALLNGQSVFSAFWLTGLVLLGPVLALRALTNPRTVSLVYGFTAMLMGALLVHFGQGPVQIEMHFYFFALLAMLAVFGNPLAIVVAAVTVALHHLLGWAYVPTSLFNYQAPLWVVLVHAAFVVVESVATCFIARSFFDNVIGLEKIVAARTAQLDARNRDMRLVLDTTNQGLLTIDRTLHMSTEKSAVIDTWFGASEAGQTFVAYLERHDVAFAQKLGMAWDQLIEDMLPLSLTIDQLPKRLSAEERHFSLQYSPIMQGETLEKVLVTITDISAEIIRERLESEQHDVLQLLRRVANDKAGVLEFVSEACKLVVDVVDPELQDMVLFKRSLHTLKGNAMIFGVQTISQLCHSLESMLEETGVFPGQVERDQLHQAWNKLSVSVDMLLGSREHPRIEIDDTEYESLLRAVLRGDTSERLAERIRAWKLEPTVRRLQRASEQAQTVAQRLQKGTLRFTLDDQGMRLDGRNWASFWGAFVHVVRNAVDHGIEMPEERVAHGKSAEGHIQLSTRVEDQQLVIAIEDDGRGIDWAMIAQRAHQLGLPYQTHADLVEVLFSDGVSTRSDVSEYSGRGVGMGVVRDACRQRSGEIHVQSHTGRGTRIEFRFPVEGYRAGFSELQRAS
jgi:HPt (histidine-containing phosphotransfer) domain-containing protein/two-component sensor histidine kinase